MARSVYPKDQGWVSIFSRIVCAGRTLYAANQISPEKGAYASFLAELLPNMEVRAPDLSRKISMLLLNLRKFMQAVALVLVGSALSACTSDPANRPIAGAASSNAWADWGPNAGPWGMGGEGPSARPGD